MSTAPVSTLPTTPDGATAPFGQIACACASAIDVLQVAQDADKHAKNAMQRVDSLIVAAQALIAQAGAIADACAKQQGAAPHVGDFATWACIDAPDAAVAHARQGPAGVAP